MNVFKHKSFLVKIFFNQNQLYKINFPHRTTKHTLRIKGETFSLKGSR